MKKIIALVLACVLALSMTGCENDDYNEAMRLYEAGNYVEAEQLFMELGDHKDSIQMRLACRYGHAMQLYDAGQYEEAQKLFQRLDTYEDSAQMVSACHYAYAVSLQEAGEYEAALEMFSKAAGYEDSDVRSIACRQEYAEMLIKDGEYEKAVPQLTALKTLDALDADSNALGWCTLAAYLQENRGFSNVQTYAYTMRLTQEGSIELIARLSTEDDSNNLVTATTLDYTLTLAYGASQAEMSYLYETNTTKRSNGTIRTGYGKETASAEVNIADFRPEAMRWDNLQFEGVNIYNAQVTKPFNALSGTDLALIFNEMNKALSVMKLEITLRDLGFVSAAV